MEKKTFIRYATLVLLFLNTFASEAIFRQRTFEDKSIDFQVILKMGIWAVTLCFCLYFFRVWAKKIFRIDQIFQFLLLLIILVSCFYAPSLMYSLAATFSLTAVFCLLLMSSAVLTNRQIIRQIIWGCSLVSFLSIIVYFVNPDLGRMKEWVNGVHVPGRRLSGITGTGNASGYIAALCLLALYYYRRYLPPRASVFFWCCVAVNVIALIMSNSRTSMLATVTSIAIAGVFKMSPPRLAAVFIGVCAAIIFFMAIDLDTLFSMLARSGDASEIETGTGRTEIWSVVVRMIGQRPLLGYGYGSSISILPDAAGAPHAHNAILQVLFSIGIVGLICFIALIAIKVYYSVKSGDPLNIAFIFFLMIDGLTEPIAFQGPATTTTLVLATVLALNYRDRNETDNRSYQQRLPGPVTA